MMALDVRFLFFILFPSIVLMQWLVIMILCRKFYLLNPFIVAPANGSFMCLSFSSFLKYVICHQAWDCNSEFDWIQPRRMTLLRGKSALIKDFAELLLPRIVD